MPNSRTNRNRSRGGQKSSTTNRKSKTQTQSSTSSLAKSGSISKYFAKLPNGTMSESECSESPYRDNLSSAKHLSSNDSASDLSDFKTPVAIKKVSKLKPKEKAVRKTRKKTKVPPLKQFLQDNFQQGIEDCNVEHLQMALALSESSYQLENPDEKKTSFKEALQKFGFQYGTKNAAKERPQIKKIPKKSKFRFITPALFSRTDQDRDALISSKVASILTTNTRVETTTKHQTLSLLSDNLSKLHISKIFPLNNLHRYELKETLFYTQLDFERVRPKVGGLLKNWHTIAGRDKSPIRYSNKTHCGNTALLLEQQSQQSQCGNVALPRDFMLNLSESQQSHCGHFATDDDSEQSQCGNRARDEELCHVTLERESETGGGISPDLFASDSDDLGLDNFSSDLKQTSVENLDNFTFMDYERERPLELTKTDKSLELGKNWVNSPDIDSGVGTLTNGHHKIETEIFDLTQSSRDSSDSELEISVQEREKSTISIDRRSFNLNVELDSTNELNVTEYITQILNKNSSESLRFSSKVETKDNLSQESSEEAIYISDEELNYSSTNATPQSKTKKVIIQKKVSYDLSDVDENMDEEVYEAVKEHLSLESHYTLNQSLKYQATLPHSASVKKSSRLDKDPESHTDLADHSYDKGNNSKIPIEDPDRPLTSTDGNGYNDSRMGIHDLDCRTPIRHSTSLEFNKSVIFNESVNHSPVADLDDEYFDALERNLDLPPIDVDEDNASNRLNPIDLEYPPLETNKSSNDFDSAINPSSATDLDDDYFDALERNLNSHKQNNHIDLDYETVESLKSSSSLESPSNDLELEVQSKTPNQRFLIKTNNITPIVDYDSMNTPNITKELNKYGLKPLKRQRGVELLKYIYESTHPVVDSNDLDDCRVVKRRKTHQSEDLNDLIEIVGDLNDCDDSLVFERHQSKRIQSCRIPLNIVWHNFIACHPQLRKNILLYEPLQLEVLHSMLKEQGFRFNIQDILGFLDRKCITIRTSQAGQGRQSKKKKT